MGLFIVIFKVVIISLVKKLVGLSACRLVVFRAVSCALIAFGVRLLFVFIIWLFVLFISVICVCSIPPVCAVTAAFAASRTFAVTAFVFTDATALPTTEPVA